MNVKTILGFSLGPIASAILGLVTVPIIAWAFSPEDIGRFSLLQMVLSFSLLLLSLGLDQAYVREFHGSVDRQQLLKACFVPGFIVMTIGVIVTVWFSKQLSTWLFGISNSWLYSFTTICVVVNYISRFLSLILRMQERSLAYSVSQITPKLFQLLLLMLVVLIGARRDFFTLLSITLASSLTVLIVYTWSTRREWRPALTTHSTSAVRRGLLHFGLPLVFSGLAYWGLTATSILVLRSQSTLGELGVYSVASSFAAAATIFQSVFSIVWAPIVYRWASEGVSMNKVDVVARQALSVVCVIFVLVGLFSRLTDYLLPPHYFDVKYLVVCAITPPLLYTLSEISGVGIGISRRTELTIWVTLFALIVNLLLSLWLIPARGAAGAVIANAVSYIVYFVARAEVSARVWRQFPRLNTYVVIFIIISVSILNVISSESMPFPFEIIWLALAPIVVIYFRDEWAGIRALYGINVLQKTGK